MGMDCFFRKDVSEWEDEASVRSLPALEVGATPDRSSGRTNRREGKAPPNFGGRSPSPTNAAKGRQATVKLVAGGRIVVHKPGGGG